VSELIEQAKGKALADVQAVFSVEHLHLVSMVTNLPNTDVAFVIKLVSKLLWIESEMSVPAEGTRSFCSITSEWRRDPDSPDHRRRSHCTLQPGHRGRHSWES
jgi:hypothetical protein